MRRGTRVFLLAGCALVLMLETPATFSALAAGWSGPYRSRVAEAGSPRTPWFTPPSHAVRPAVRAAPLELQELARR